MNRCGAQLCNGDLDSQRRGLPKREVQCPDHGLKGTRILQQIIDDECRLRRGAKRDLHIALPDVGAAGPFLMLDGHRDWPPALLKCRYGFVLLPSWVSCVKRGEL